MSHAFSMMSSIVLNVLDGQLSAARRAVEAELKAKVIKDSVEIPGMPEEVNGDQ